HIPGAVFIDVMEADHTDLYPRNIPSIEVFERKVQEVGIGNDSHVIVYSDTDNAGYFMSGRGWWNFKIFGHDKVSILDGGLQKWKSLGYHSTADIPSVQKGLFKAKWNPKYYRTLEDVKKNINSNEFLVCDSRPSTSYLEQESLSFLTTFYYPFIISAGHMQGAVNVPFGNLVNKETLTLKSREQLLQEMKASGMDLSKPVVTHCNGGMSSCTLAFVAELCGNPDVAVYHVCRPLDTFMMLSQRCAASKLR
ncbi:hypothetical protein LOTGIDRAFT_115146, partial [Lottia gigantea]